MKLCYRGIEYDYTPPQVEKVSSELVGKYRGVDVRFRNPKKALVLPATLNLKYRGVAYQPEAPAVEPTATPAPQPAAPAAPTPAFALQQRMRELMLRSDRAIQKRHQTVLSRLMSEVGVKTDVEAYWKQSHGVLEHDDRLVYAPSAVGAS
jgi:hypothetical protein